MKKICFLGTSCAEPSAENGFTSFLLSDGRLTVLIDASGNPIQSLLRAEVDPLALDVVVLTHHHADHVAGYPSLIQTLSCMGRRKELQVVCREPVRSKTEELHRVFDLDAPHTSFPVRCEERYRGGGLALRLLPGHHSVPTSMVAFDGPGALLFYTADTAYRPDTAEAARGYPTLIHEATFAHAQLGEPGMEGHSSAYQAGLCAAASGAERLLLCHVCWQRYRSPAAVVQEASRAFSGEILLPEPFHWYPL